MVVGGFNSLVFLFLISGFFQFNVVYSYTRPPPGETILIQHHEPDDFPQQVHIYQVGKDRMGDLGQTGWTKSTLDHISKSKYDMLLLPGDLAYADLLQHLWDSFGRLVEPLASQRPWMVTQGNHEVEKIPKVHHTTFTAYNARWKMPYEESGSDSNLYYSFDVAGVHVIMLGSYTDFDRKSKQYKWLEGDLKKVNRENTPWLVVLVHAPWYNSNTAHQDEKESVNMKASMEDLLYHARVDVIFEGHVHAYERFARVYKDKDDKCGPIYINIGDGGNREGLAKKYIYPKPDISLFREANFGHGTLEIFNATHALWKWHKNNYNEAVVSDSTPHKKLWDSFGPLVDPLASKRPWMVTQGNHEGEKILVLHNKPLEAYKARWKMPYKESGSDSNLYYSFDVDGVHVIMLGSYTNFDSESKKYKWLQGDLRKVNRKTLLGLWC
ncbi:unnamed protein product [Lupinus luteus]|uniref:acid phosphatase n=1 Tax=Lupinus luteus TaxID=3873 RepID=A0AAV1WLK9_LUPLU